MYEIETYNLGMKDHDFTKFLHLLNEVDEFKITNSTSTNSVYMDQISKLHKNIKKELLTGKIEKKPYHFKSVVANVRDLAVLLSSQGFAAKKSCPQIQNNCNTERTFNMCCYFSQIVKNTISFSFMTSLIETLSDIWTTKVTAEVEVKRATHFLDQQVSTTFDNIAQHNNDYLYYLLLFFNGYTYGNRHLYDDLTNIRELHEKEWNKYANTFNDKISLIQRNLNYVYSCLIPFLDNQGIINVKYQKYDLLLRAFQSNFLCAGHLGQFYGHISKYNLKFSTCALSKQVKNNKLVEYLVPSSNENYFLTKTVLKDICHFHGYDNIWTGSNMFGELFLCLVCEDKMSISTIKESDCKVFLDIRTDCDIIPGCVMENMSKSFLSCNALVKSQDIYGILRYMILSNLLSEHDLMPMNMLLTLFWTQIQITKRDLLSQKYITHDIDLHKWYDILFQAALTTSQNFLHEINCCLAHLDPLETNTDHHCLITLTIYPHKYKFAKMFNSEKCTFSLLLLLAASISALQEGLMIHSVEKIVRNIPRIQTITHWNDKGRYQSMDNGSKIHMDEKGTEGLHIMRKLLSMLIHEEWTPIIVGLLLALCKLVHGTLALKDQYQEFYYYVSDIFQTEKCITNKSSMTLKDISMMQSIYNRPATQLLKTQMLYILNNQRHQFIPLLRSASLFYGGIPLLSQINSCIFPELLQTKPSKAENRGYKQFLKCLGENTKDIKEICENFLSIELFLKYDHPLIVEESDFSYPFIMYVKQSEFYKNILHDKDIQWIQ